MELMSDKEIDQKVTELIIKRPMAVAELAREIGVSPEVVNRILFKKKPIGFKEKLKVINWINKEVNGSK